MIFAANLLFLILFSLTEFCHSGKRYLNPTKGNDSNNCTESAPCKTLSYIFANVLKKTEVEYIYLKPESSSDVVIIDTEVVFTGSNYDTHIEGLTPFGKTKVKFNGDGKIKIKESKIITNTISGISVSSDKNYAVGNIINIDGVVQSSVFNSITTCQPLVIAYEIIGVDFSSNAIHSSCKSSFEGFIDILEADSCDFNGNKGRIISVVDGENVKISSCNFKNSKSENSLISVAGKNATLLLEGSYVNNNEITTTDTGLITVIYSNAQSNSRISTLAMVDTEIKSNKLALGYAVSCSNGAFIEMDKESYIANNQNQNGVSSNVYCGSDTSLKCQIKGEGKDNAYCTDPAPKYDATWIFVIVFITIFILVAVILVFGGIILFFCLQKNNKNFTFFTAKEESYSQIGSGFSTNSTSQSTNVQNYKQNVSSLGEGYGTSGNDTAEDPLFNE